MFPGVGGYRLESPESCSPPGCGNWTTANSRSARSPMWLPHKETAAPYCALFRLTQPPQYVTDRAEPAGRVPIPHRSDRCLLVAPVRTPRTMTIATPDLARPHSGYAVAPPRPGDSAGRANPRGALQALATRETSRCHSLTKELADVQVNSLTCIKRRNAPGRCAVCR